MHPVTCDGRTGGDATSTARAPATTSGNQARTSRRSKLRYLWPADQLAYFTGDPSGPCQQREVMAQHLSHRPAEFARPGRLVFVGLAELEIAAGSVRPPWRGRMNFLQHGQRQPGTPGGETLPDSRIGEKRGQFLLFVRTRPDRVRGLPRLTVRGDDQEHDHHERSSHKYQNDGGDAHEDPVLACLPLPVLQRNFGPGRMIARGRIVQIDASGPCAATRPPSPRATEPNHRASRHRQPAGTSMR